MASDSPPSTGHPFKVGDRIRMFRVPPHVDRPYYPLKRTQRIFRRVIFRPFTVLSLDWGGWVELHVTKRDSIFVQPDCVEFVPPKRVRKRNRK
jgi:hypothetical protein